MFLSRTFANLFLSCCQTYSVVYNFPSCGYLAFYACATSQIESSVVLDYGIWLLLLIEFVNSCSCQSL